MRRFFRKPAADGAPTGSAEPQAPLVLVIDDSLTETRVLAHTLSKAGYRVEMAADGREGVDLARRLRPDLILMDIVMPALNGFEATRLLQRDEATAGIPIVMITSKDQPTDRTWGLRQGAVDYLVKPVDSEALLGRIRAILGR